MGSYIIIIVGVTRIVIHPRGLLTPLATTHTPPSRIPARILVSGSGC